MLQVESDRCQTSRAFPQQIVRKPIQHRADFISSLDERVRNGLQQDGNTVDGSTKPCLWLCHNLSIVAQREWTVVVSPLVLIRELSALAATKSQPAS